MMSLTGERGSIMSLSGFYLLCVSHLDAAIALLLISQTNPILQLEI
jgi:hypothetical protein